MVITVEPGARSVATARKIITLARDIGLGTFSIVANKIRTKAEAGWVAAQFPGNPPAAIIPYSETIARADFEERSLSDMLDDDLRGQFEAVYRAIK